MSKSAPLCSRKVGSATAWRNREIASLRWESLRPGRRRTEISAESELGTIADSRAFGVHAGSRLSQMTEETKLRVVQPRNAGLPVLNREALELLIELAQRLLVGSCRGLAAAR